MLIRVLILTFSLGVASGQSVGELTQQASQLVLQHQWEKAISLLRAGLDQHLRQPELLLQLGSLLVRSGRFEEGEKLLQKALKQQPWNSEVLRNAGEAQLKQGRFASAVALFRESLRHSSENVEAHHRLAFSLLAQGQDERALEHSRRAVELNPLDPRFRRLYAFLLDTQGEEETAYEQLKLAYLLAPRDSKLLFDLSQRRRLAGHLFQALEYLELATEVDPENPLYHQRLSDLYEQLGQTERAEEEAKRESKLRQAFEQYITAMSLTVKGKRVEAIDILEPVVQAHPEFVTGMMLLADLYQKLGQRSQAFDLYVKILEQDPFQTSAREEVAWIQVQQGLLNSALELLEKSGVQTPNYTLISAYQRMTQEDWAGALQYFRQVEAQNPLHPGLLQLISYCLKAQGKREEALRHLDKAEALRPGDPEIKLQMREIKFEDALHLLSEKRWSAALEILQELVKEDVQANYLLRMAYCHQQLGDLRQAAQEYRAGLEAEPTATWARINFASTLYRLGDYQESANQWERILPESKTSDTYYQLGLSYAHLGRFPEAEYAFDKAVQSGDQRPEVLYNLGLSRLRSKKLNEARDLIRRAAVGGYPPAREFLPKLVQ